MIKTKDIDLFCIKRVIKYKGYYEKDYLHHCFDIL